MFHVLQVYCNLFYMFLDASVKLCCKLIDVSLVVRAYYNNYDITIDVNYTHVWEQNLYVSIFNLSFKFYWQSFWKIFLLEAGFRIIYSTPCTELFFRSKLWKIFAYPDDRWKPDFLGGKSFTPSFGQVCGQQFRYKITQLKSEMSAL